MGAFTQPGAIWVLSPTVDAVCRLNDVFLQRNFK